MQRKSEEITETGWTEWIHPKGDKNGVYKQECCDCSLVHDFEFKVVKPTNQINKIYFESDDIEDDNIRIVFRARRNNRATSAVRRWKKKDETLKIQEEHE